MLIMTLAAGVQSAGAVTELSVVPAQQNILQANTAAAGKLELTKEAKPAEYTIGVDDLLTIAVLQPEQLAADVTVAPDGSITFPYIGSVTAAGLTLSAIQKDIEARLSAGYMKYPVVSVSLKEARSRKFFVYGEVMRPGTFMLTQNTTVLRAITMAGGFTRFGSKNTVKVLRPRKNKPGYEAIKVNIKGIMNGNSDEDLLIQPEDIVVVSEGVF
jgi:polysaccharide export outer membrane protein